MLGSSAGTAHGMSSVADASNCQAGKRVARPTTEMFEHTSIDGAPRVVWQKYK
jgi:hypothetical protein